MTTDNSNKNATKSYKCMYVIPKELYKSLTSVSSQSQSSLKSVSPESQSSLKSVSPQEATTTAATTCGKDFKHPNILAHHTKSHVDGFKCNICKKVFNHPQDLQDHLTQHAADTSKKYDALEGKIVIATAAEAAVIHHCPICKKSSKHKRNLARHIRSHGHNCLNFTTSNWVTLH